MTISLHQPFLDNQDLKLLKNAFQSNWISSGGNYTNKFEKVFKYLTKKYKDSVAHIITFGILKARMVIRDVGRVLGLPYGFVDSISKMIPFDPSRTLSLIQCINSEPRFQN